jgi:autotransporter-associated beta strand protein
MKRLLPLIIGLALLCKTDAYGLALYFWDTDGVNPGAGGSTPTGTWGVDSYWSKDDSAGNAGVQATVPWPAGNFAVFAAGNDAVGAYTVNVSGIVTVADIHVDLGTVTFDPAPVTGGSLKLTDDSGNGAGRLLSVGHKTPDAVARYNVSITDATSVTRYKRGTLIFGAINTFTGPFTIEGGVVQCAVANALAAANPLLLSNNDTTRGDFDAAWQYTPAVFHTGGLDQQLGTLKVMGTDASVLRVLDLGNGDGTLSFADSSAEDWGGITLTIANYALGHSKLRFGTSNAGLTTGQLSGIQFTDFANLPGVIDGSGYVTPNLPRITSITPSSVSVDLVWTAVVGRTYRVWSKDTLTATSWDNLSNVFAVGDTASYTDSTPSPTGRFYRVEVLP